MNREEITSALIREGYAEKQAELTATELMEIDSSLMPLLSEWVRNRKQSEKEAEGFTLLGLQAQYDMTYPAALLTIDWLIKEPQIARIAIERGIK